MILYKSGIHILENMQQAKISLSRFKSALLIILLFLSSLSFSQTVDGVVKNMETGEPLEGVHIISSGIKNTTISEETGKFIVHLKEGYSSKDSIFFSSVGFVSRGISLAELKAKNEVFLIPAVEELKEVDLSSQKILNKKLRFSELAPMNNGVYSFGSVVVGNKIYVVAGDASILEEPIKEEMARSLGNRGIAEIINSSMADFSMPRYSEDIQVYEPEKDEWTTLAETVIKRAGHNVILHEDRIYILGGKRLVRSGQKVLLADKIEILDLGKDTLLLDHVNPHQSSGAAAVIHNGDLLVMGGSVRIDKRRLKEFTDDIHLFNFESGAWFRAGKLPVGKETNSVIIGNKLYTIGGNDRNWLNTVESLNLGTGKWETEAKLPHSPKDPAVVANGDLIYIYERGRIHTFDTAEKEMKTYSIDLKVEGPNVHILNDQLFIIGGYDQNGYKIKPLTGSYKVDLIEFNKTEVKQRVRF